MAIQPSASWWHKQGITLTDWHRYGKAVVSFNRVWEIQPNYNKVWDYRGVAWGKLGCHAEAVASFDIGRRSHSEY